MALVNTPRLAPSNATPQQISEFKSAPAKAGTSCAQTDLLGQDGLDGGRVGVRLGVNIGDDGDAGRVDGGLVKGGLGMDQRCVIYRSSRQLPSCCFGATQHSKEMREAKNIGVAA